MTKQSSYLIRASTSAVVAGLFIVGCTTTTKAIKSSNAKSSDAMIGDAATQGAARLSVVQGGPAKGKRDSKLETVALFGGPAMPVGIAVSQSGRMFMAFPRWNDPVKSTAVELKAGKLDAFPDADVNMFDGTKLDKTPPASHLISTQAVVFDSKDRLWLLDPGSFNFGVAIQAGPKLWGYDINTGQRIKAISFPNDVAMKMTSLNDVRFDLKRGPEGTAYITDSGVGGMIIVDLASGKSWRHLDGHPSVLPDISVKPTSEGQPFMMRKATGEQDAPDFRSDGVALSPDGKLLYYMSVVSHKVYSVPTDLLADPNADEQKIGAEVKTVAEKPSGNDGIWCTPDGMIYTTDFEDNAIRKIDPKTGQVSVVVQDERLIWPDTLAFHAGYLYVTSNQLARQANYHYGKDIRQPPYALFRIRVGG